MFDPNRPEIEQFTQKDEAFEEKRSLPKFEELPGQLKEVAAGLESISSDWNPVEIYTADPELIKVEKAKVFEAYKKGEEYNPEFTYARAQEIDTSESEPKLRALQQKVRDFQPQTRDERLARVAFDRKIQDDIATTKIVDGIKTGDDAKIAEGMKKKYPGTDKALIETAKARYKELCQPETKSEKHQGVLNEEEIAWLRNRKFNAEGLKAAFEYVLQRYGILRHDTEEKNGYLVVLDERATSIDVRNKSVIGQAVFVPNTREVDGVTLLTLLDHEIGGHARQAINGEKLFGIGGGALRFDDEALYEGLAMRNESETNAKLFGKTDAMPLPYYALGVKSAEEGKSFAQIFSEQVDYRIHARLKIDPDQPLPDKSSIDASIVKSAMDGAWMATYRIMRGHIDTTNKQAYAMSKDLAYLRGYLVQAELDRQGKGHLNETGVIADGGLMMLAEYRVDAADLPIQYELTDELLGKVSPAHHFFEAVLKPMMVHEKEQARIKEITGS